MVVSNGVPCIQNRSDCVSNHNGFCISLADTHFDKPCPFHLTASQRAKAEANVEKRGLIREAKQKVPTHRIRANIDS